MKTKRTGVQTPVGFHPLVQGLKVPWVLTIFRVSRLEFEFRFNSLVIDLGFYSQESCSFLCKMGVMATAPQRVVIRIKWDNSRENPLQNA